MENGLKVTINADNMTVSNTDVFQEFKVMKDTFNLTKEEIISIFYNSIDGAFLSNNEKDKLRQLINLKIDWFIEEIKK